MNQNITANYYPIQTAIAMTDSNTGMSMVVMNSRSQGGSVIQDGRIELMQNRRLNEDDWRGMGEPLNETDSQGNGISVPATYFVQVYNTNSQRSLQRVVQQLQDNPVTTWFAFGAEEVAYKAQAGEDILAAAGFTDEMKLLMFPLAKNKIQLRIENIADIYNGALEVQTINLLGLATDLYKQANSGASPDSVQIEETSLTGNMSWEELVDRKITWKTTDDSVAPINDPTDAIAMQQQRIRVFSVEFNAPSKAFLAIQ